MSSGVLIWYGSLSITLLRFVGSKQILSFKLPILSHPQQTQSCLYMGLLHVLALKLSLSASYQFLAEKASFKSTRIGLQGVCFDVIFGSNCIWYGGPGKHPILSKTSR